MPTIKRTSLKYCAALCVLASSLFSIHSAQATHFLDCSSGKGGKGRFPVSLNVAGLTDDGRLVCFNQNRPSRAQDIGYVNGLVAPDIKLVGIDFRVKDGQLYGVGNGGGVYTLDPRTAVATLVNRLNANGAPIVLAAGARFGVDFNPAADRLRIVDDQGNNFRHNVDAGGVTIVDSKLTYTVPPLGSTTPPQPAPGIVAAAYVNNDADTNTGTVLFDLDSNLDQVAVQSPPNNGFLVVSGRLGLDVTDASFDIYSIVKDGRTLRNRGFAALQVDGKYGFYRIVPESGQVFPLGRFRDNVVDIAIPLNQ